MPYAVVAYFDPLSDQVIRDTWKALADAGVCDYLYRSANNPHIKLGMLDDLNVGQGEEVLRTLARTTQRLRVHFKNIGIYPGEKPIVFLDISASYAILDLQRRVQRDFANYPCTVGANYFEPGIWKPDCFLSMAIEREKLGRAVDIALAMQLPWDGFVERIGLIEFHPARQIVSYLLNNE